MTDQRERESRFTELFESLHEAVYFTTPEGRVLDANHGMVRKLGYENKAALLASNAADHYLNLKDRQSFVHDLEQMNTLRDREVLLRKRDGTPVVCLESSSAISDSDGNVIRFQGTLVDISARRQIEHRLQQQEEFNRRLIECFPDAILALDHEDQAIREVRDRGTIRIRIGHSPAEIRVTFQDDGPGISSESVPKIFDPFYSTKRPGRGLGMGLSVAMAIVKSSDGKIDFTPAPGGGAAFTITLPLGRAAGAHSAN